VRNDRQLRAEGDISYVQFQLLARLAHACGPPTMTELADGVVYSRSGLTCQAGLLEKAGLITRDHMRAQPPRSATSRKHRAAPPVR
jgi:DNA-binding MarR family transcriptional regulator